MSNGDIAISVKSDEFRKQIAEPPADIRFAPNSGY
jgi:hypothetical protein